MSCIVPPPFQARKSHVRLPRSSHTHILIHTTLHIRIQSRSHTHTCSHTPTSVRTVRGLLSRPFPTSVTVRARLHRYDHHMRLILHPRRDEHVRDDARRDTHDGSSTCSDGEVRGNEEEEVFDRKEGPAGDRQISWAGYERCHREARATRRPRLGRDTRRAHGTWNPFAQITFDARERTKDVRVADGQEHARVGHPGQRRRRPDRCFLGPASCQRRNGGRDRRTCTWHEGEGYCGRCWK